MNLHANLELEFCPHCSVAHPNIFAKSDFITTKDHAHVFERAWRVYQCATCGGALIACAAVIGQHPQLKLTEIVNIYPEARALSENIPEITREYLRQAKASLHAPSGAIMLAATSVDCMLKQKGLIDGTLYKRIDEAAGLNFITKYMALWAHTIRLDANQQRHLDMTDKMPTRKDAETVVEFAIVLADILYEYPARVERGMQNAST